MRNTWVNALKLLSGRIKKAEFNVWFQKTGLLTVESGVATVSVPNIFAKQIYLDKKYDQVILEVLQTLIAELSSVELVVKEHEDAVDLSSLNQDGASTKSRKVNNKNELKYTFNKPFENSVSIVTKVLNQKYSLQNFVVGDNNKLAHAACEAVSVKPGYAYNPLFVYGNVGLGKTHLLQATGNAILKNKPNAVVVYLTAEKFTNEIIESISKNKTKSFRNKYRNVDCLIIDDIQFLATKNRTQEEFFHTFNELYHESKQIIISSDKPPKDLEGVESRLVSRFEMGMIVDISKPDFETNYAILLQKSQEQQLFIEKDVIEFMALNSDGSVRELEGLLTQVVAQSKLMNVPASIDMVASILKKNGKYVSTDQKNKVTLESKVLSCKEIIENVAGFYNLTRFDLLSERRNREINLPRQVAIYILRNDFNYSYEKIGLEFNGRNHTTAMHACKKIKTLLKKDLTLKQQVNEIRSQVGL